MSSNIVVAIDGYSSCGKSTMAKALAKKLDFIYVDTGAMYRAVSLYFLRNEVDLTNEAEVKDALSKINLSFQTRDSQTNITLNDEDVSEEIRMMPVANMVSKVAAIPAVRVEMVKQQQRLGESKNVIMDGRDIGTVVFPNAQVKLFMTADPLIRAERRHKELVPKNPEITLDEVFKSLAERDHQDTTRAESPLTRADDAITLDNSHLTPDQQLEFAISKIQPFLG